MKTVGSLLSVVAFMLAIAIQPVKVWAAEPSLSELGDANLQLAVLTVRSVNAQYQKALLSQRNGGTVSDEEINKLKQNLSSATQQLERAINGEPVFRHQKPPNDVTYRYIRQVLKVAEAEFEKAQAANRQNPGTVPSHELELLRLRVAQSALGVEILAVMHKKEEANRD